VKKIIKLHNRIGWRRIGEEIVTFNCNNQNIVIWNNTASELWELLMNKKNVDEMVNYLVNGYSIDSITAFQDTNNFLQECYDLGFITYKNGNPNTSTDDVHLKENGENILLAIEMRAIEKLIPFAITFETTYACNEECIHCYMDRGIPSLKFPKIKSILKEISEAGCLFITFTGGEFFARKDALKIIEYANELNFVIDILSNGTLINAEIANYLKNNSVRRVQISLYGSTDKTHDGITGLQNSFKQTIAGVKSLRKAGIKVEIAFPLMKQNFSE